jgi:hypothetical protein
MPAPNQIWNDEEEEAVTVPSVSGAELLGVVPSQTEVAPQDLSPVSFRPILHRLAPLTQAAASRKVIGR